MSLLSPQLEAFLAIAEQKTVHAAAETLHLTQTAVTQRLKTLENKLKVSLFSRTRRGMILTPEGESLLHYCYAAKDLEGEAMANITGAGQEATVRINITGPTSLMRSRITPQCFKVMRKFPNLLMHFAISDEENRDQAVRAGISQFAVVQAEEIPKEMQRKLLAPENYVLVCSSDWRERDLKEILQNERIIDFNPSDQMTFNYLKQYNLLNLANKERHYINRTMAIAWLISEGFGYGVLTQEFSKPYVDRGELMVLNDGKVYENLMALIWYPRPEPPKYFQAIVDAIQ